MRNTLYYGDNLPILREHGAAVKLPPRTNVTFRQAERADAAPDAPKQAGLGI